MACFSYVNVWAPVCEYADTIIICCACDGIVVLHQQTLKPSFKRPVKAQRVLLEKLV